MKYKATTNSKHSLPVSPNLVRQDFSVAVPNLVWVTDITYVSTGEGWLYLAAVVDLYSRRVVGWATSNKIDRFLAVEALEMAITRRRPKAGLIVHSDRGSVFCSEDFRRKLEIFKCVSSMSRKGNCYDNACAESFFHSIKVEWLQHKHFYTRNQARLAIEEYIELFYNRIRLHSSIGYISPCDFEKAG
jgi:transposase InsO family protein